MKSIKKSKIANGLFWIEIPEKNFYMQCGCPRDSVKHLIKNGHICIQEKEGIHYESGPNVILLSDVGVQNGHLSNLSEFPILHMLYRQGMIIPGHPNNTGLKPTLIGSAAQVKAQKNYIYRGNYGLVNIEEIMSAGIDEVAAKEMMRLKLKFAFGNIKKTSELIDTRIIGNEPIEVKKDITIQRISINIFELKYKEESIIIDLNLNNYELYESSYDLGFHKVNREYFSILHSGEGDGWDSNRPCMSSILMFQGKIYLIDAGPNILSSLNALSIGISEVEGIFHTHGHDDHFSGLTALMQADHKIKYYATSLVRMSVQKKMAALAGIQETQFSDIFDIKDLNEGEWNNIEGLEVKPLISPHPVETTIFVFRAKSKDGYKSYGHFADLTGLDILKNMITGNNDELGISEEYYSQTQNKYLEPLDVKKIDIGGGMIHGNALDFKTDESKKIILAHLASKLSKQQKEIGSSAPFGIMDILIKSNRNYLQENARK